MHPKDAEGIANSVDPDQTAPSGSALFAQTCLSENLGTLRYQQTCKLLIVMQKVIFQKRMRRRQVGPEVCLDEASSSFCGCAGSHESSLLAYMSRLIT